MNREIRGKYIQFAIDNNFKKIVNGDLIEFDKFDNLYANGKVILYKGNLSLEINFTELITLKEFIEAVARGLYIGNNSVRVKIDSVFNKLIDEITFEQALAIRDGQLEFFIKDLIL